MYEDIFTQIRNEAERRNLKENTINAYLLSGRLNGALFIRLFQAA